MEKPIILETSRFLETAPQRPHIQESTFRLVVVALLLSVLGYSNDPNLDQDVYRCPCLYGV